MALAPGLLSFVQITVTDTDTAIAMGSGDMPVLGTPRLLALAEAAAVAAITPSLEPGLAPGLQVHRQHKLRTDSPDDQDTVVGAGTLERVLVDKERFVSRARS